MAGLHDVVEAVSQRPGVEAVVLVSPDGLPIDHASGGGGAAGGGIDAEAIAALTATLAQHTEDVGRNANRGPFRTGVLEFGHGLMVLAEVGDEGLLVVVVKAGTDIGQLLFDLHRHRPAVAELL